MKRMIALVLALMLALPVLCAAADMPDTRGMRPRDAYLAGTQAYENKEYADAAVYFEAAGNHADAQMWAFYCQAICLMMNDEATKRDIVNNRILKWNFLKPANDDAMMKAAGFATPEWSSVSRVS